MENWKIGRSFDDREVIENVRIDVSRAHFWDISAVTALDKVVLKFRREGAEVEILFLPQLAHGDPVDQLCRQRNTPA